jgi:hypothetical protein
MALGQGFHGDLNRTSRERPISFLTKSGNCAQAPVSESVLCCRNTKSSKSFVRSAASEARAKQVSVDESKDPWQAFGWLVGLFDNRPAVSQRALSYSARGRPTAIHSNANENAVRRFSSDITGWTQASASLFSNAVLYPNARLQVFCEPLTICCMPETVSDVRTVFTPPAFLGSSTLERAVRPSFRPRAESERSAVRRLAPPRQDDHPSPAFQIRFTNHTSSG